MTPPINSVSDERLAEMLVGLAGRTGSRREFDKSILVAPDELRPIITELAARRAADTPVSEWVYLVHDWEINEPGKRGYSYARTPERAERLAKNGVKLTPVYTRHPASDFSASPTLPSQVVGVNLADAATALERSLESEGSGVNAYLRDDIEQAIAAMRSCLPSPAAEPVEAVELMVTELLDTSKVADPQMRKRAAFMLMRLYTHPAPSASREVTVTNEMVEMAADALERQFVAGGPDVSWDKAARAALLAALPEREV